MYFNVDNDTGSRVEGYIVPDSYSDQPAFYVTDGSNEIYRDDCTVFHPAIVNAGRHQTGYVGFILTEEQIPGLSTLTTLAIFDAKTHILIYRRFNQLAHLNKRVLRLETQFLPQANFDLSLKPYFQYWVPAIEQYGHESITQMFHLTEYPSFYVSGRILVRNFEPFFGADLTTIVSFRKPFYELAIRLLYLSQYRKNVRRTLSQRDEMIFAEAIDYFSDMNFRDEKSVKDKILNAPKHVLAQFQSPFTTQLSTKAPGDKLNAASVSQSISTLSQFNLFCPHEDTPDFAEDFAEMLGIPPNVIRMQLAQKEFSQFADFLSTIGPLEQVLQDDLILYHYVQEAVLKAAS